ncbi:Calmodulin-like protein 1 [Orchesella cincta]|uniref:Calmodulin-like protein 1 n=1 Tax=Orchesella cincta TaxID=48709 RepID=A0A1D2N9P9_ORCCI|nr:Calmodulin-like protein 1 [Orchesella cincta]
MGGGISAFFGTPEEASQEYLQMTELGRFLSKYVFIMLDKDKTKQVSKKEYLTLVNQFREQKTSEEELDAFLQQHAESGQSTEYIDEVLFRKLIIYLAIDFDKNVSDRMKYLMGLFDKDQDGFVSEFDLCEVYDSIGISVPLEPIRCLIQRYDIDGDNKLSVEEFEQLGRSAMSKLFESNLETPEDVLVEEAIRKGSAGLTLSKSDEDILNNNPRVRGVTFVEDVAFGKPVEITESSMKSCISEQGATMCSGIGDFVDSVSIMEKTMNDLQLD